MSVAVGLASPAAAGEDEAEPSILDHVPALSVLKNARDALADKGFRLSGFYFADPRAILDGGMREDATYSGLLNLALELDGEKVFGVEGGRLHASMLQIHGKDLSDEYVGNLMSVNDIGARPTTRLFELWWDQEIDDRLSLRFGQMAADEEFIKSEYSEDMFIGATLGWAAPPSENLPQGGPAYPFASLGVQATWKASENLTLVGAIYNGTPARPDAADPEKANRHGLNFRLKDPPLVILESRLAFDGLNGLPGVLKLGGYGHFGRFDDLKYGTDGLVLGSPGSNDDPRRHRGNVNFYAIVDQQVWRAPGDDPQAGIGVFARVIAGRPDRNAISFYVDGGIVASGLVPGRPDDKFGIAAAYADFSPRLADVDRAENAASGLAGAVRRFEGIIEATYKAQLLPGFTVQPTLQYVVRPGSGPPEDGGKRIPNATVFGVTTVVTF
ncbi:carbohydrate porin [Chenggangzhangella methanolivorans]